MGILKRITVAGRLAVKKAHSERAVVRIKLPKGDARDTQRRFKATPQEFMDNMVSWWQRDKIFHFFLSGNETRGYGLWIASPGIGVSIPSGAKKTEIMGILKEYAKGIQRKNPGIKVFVTYKKNL